MEWRTPFTREAGVRPLPRAGRARSSDAQFQENLYLASIAERKRATDKALPVKFTQMVPKLKASDYDYIIFDLRWRLRPVRLPGWPVMDLTLLVVESEKTGSE